MKKLVLFLALACLGLVSAQAQTACNDAILGATENAQAGQGWILSSTQYAPINYLVQPDYPYPSATITQVYVPDCEPLEPCPRIAKIIVFEEIQVNQNVCIVKKK